MIRIAHLSDPHFAKITFNPMQFFSKRWIGNLNLLFIRNQFYDTKPLFQLPELLNTLNVDAIFFTGDFSSTALFEEFDFAKTFLSLFQKPVYIVPGNHDVYTKESEEKKTFYSFFPQIDLETKKIAKHKIISNWWAIALDCALATPPFFSYGLFTPAMEVELDKTLKEIPPNDHVILYNHFPLTFHGNYRHDLRGSNLLENVIKKHPQVKLYLHGHDHIPYIEDRRHEKLPLINNCGSCSRKKEGGFSILSIQKNKIHHERYVFNKTWFCKDASLI